MEIWEEKYNDEKYGLEQPISFKHFRNLLERTNRNYKEYAKELILNELESKNIKIVNKLSNNSQPNIYEITEKEFENKVKRKLNTIKTYSCKWHYQDRFNAYDNYNHEQTIKNKQRIIDAFEQEILDPLAQSIKINMNHKISISKDNELSKKDKSRALLDIDKATETAINNIYNVNNSGIRHDKSIKEVNMDLNQKLIKDNDTAGIDDLFTLYEDGSDNGNETK